MFEELNFGTKEERENFTAKTKKAFVKDGKIVVLPAQLKKRVVLWLEIAKEFEKGKSYTETEVSDVIRSHIDDYCTARREMVMLRILNRNEGVYCLSDEVAEYFEEE